MKSSFWWKILGILLFCVAANPGKKQFQFQNLDFGQKIQCSTHESPSEEDPLDDQRLFLFPQKDLQNPRIYASSLIHEGQFYKMNMNCHLDLNQLLYRCEESDYKFFQIEIKSHWSTQIKKKDKIRVYFQGSWMRGRLYLNPHKIICYQDIKKKMI